MLAELPCESAVLDLNWTIERRISERTWGRIHHLRVEVTPERVIVRGAAASYYLKQLAVAAVSETLAMAMISLAVEVDIRVGPSAAGRAASYTSQWEPCCSTWSDEHA